jgi:hypothetical protein
MITAEVEDAVCHILARDEVDPARHPRGNWQLVRGVLEGARRTLLTETVLRAFWRIPSLICARASNQVAYTSRTRDPTQARRFTDATGSAARTLVLIQEARKVVLC